MRIRTRSDAEAVEKEIIALETTLREMVTKQDNVNPDNVSKYLTLITFYLDKPSFPATFTSCLFQELLLCP